MTFAEFIRHYIDQLPSDRVVAEYELKSVLSHVVGVSRTELMLSLADTMSESVYNSAVLCVKRLMAHEPLGYVLGSVSFLNRDFLIEPGVLVPRPETEELVQLVLNRITSEKWAVGSIVECGVGSGVIGLSLASECSGFDVSGWDISEASRRVAESNKQRLGCDNVVFHLGSFLDLTPEVFSVMKSPRILVSNPPYVTNEEMLSLDPSVSKYEPKEALTDGGDGLAFYRYFVSLVPYFDVMYFECGESQAESIVGLFDSVAKAKAVDDMFGKKRFVVVEKL